MVKTPAAVKTTDEEYPQAGDMMVDSDCTESYLSRVPMEREPVSTNPNSSF